MGRSRRTKALSISAGVKARVYERDGGRCMLPLSIQVNHAVCDGFHVCRLIVALKEMLAGGENLPLAKDAPV